MIGSIRLNWELLTKWSTILLTGARDDLLNLTTPKWNCTLFFIWENLLCLPSVWLIQTSSKFNMYEPESILYMSNKSSMHLIPQWAIILCRINATRKCVNLTVWVESTQGMFAGITFTFFIFIYIYTMTLHDDPSSGFWISLFHFLRDYFFFQNQLMLQAFNKDFSNALSF